MNQFWDRTCQEIADSVLRYCQHCLQIGSSYIVVEEEKKQSVFKDGDRMESNSFEGFFHKFKEEPNPVFIDGHEERLRKTDDLSVSNIKDYWYFYS